MEEQLISYETAKLAKEKGFDEKVYREYDKSGYLRCTSKSADVVLGPYDELLKSTEYPAPTQSLLQRWLREVHNCFIDILPHRDGDSKNKRWKSKKDVFWSVEVDYYGKDFEIELTDDADFTQHFNKSYEEALEIGLYQALKLIK